MKVNFQLKLSQQQQSKWTEFWSKCRSARVQQHLLFAEVELGKGKTPIYVSGEIDNSIVCLGIFSIRPLFFGNRFSLEAICLDGPAFDDVAHAKEFLECIIRHFKKLSVGRIRLSPPWYYPEAQAVEAVLSDLGFSPCRGQSGFRVRTGQVDLQRSEDEIMASFSKSARREVRRAQRQGVSIRPAQNLEEAEKFFQELNTMLKSRGAVRIAPKSYRVTFWNTLIHQNLGIILNAFKDSVFLGGLLVVRGQYVAYGSYFVVIPHVLRGFSNLRIAPIIWLQGMYWAKRHGCCCFDVQGYSEQVDASDPLYRIYNLHRIYKYKGEFGPKPVQRLGESVYVCNSIIYTLYRGYDFYLRGLKFAKSLPYQLKARWPRRGAVRGLENKMVKSPTNVFRRS